MTERLTPDLEKTLRRYALGDVQDELRSELEELLVTDPDAFEALGVVEDELIEEYLDGAATEADRLAFEGNFLTSPRREARLRFARALRSRARLGTRAKTTAPRTGTQARWQPPWLGLAAALAVSLVGNVWLAIRRPVQPNAAGLPAPIAQVQPAPPLQPIGAVPSEGEDARAALQRERDERLRAEARVEALQKELRPPPGGVATFALAAGALRSSGHAQPVTSPGAMQRVTPPSGALAVRLRLELSGDDYPLYWAALVDADGEELWSASRLKSETEGEESAVFIVLPAALLPRGDYQVKLRGGAERERLETVGAYPFRVGFP